MADQGGDVVRKGKMVELDDSCNGTGTSQDKTIHMIGGDVEHSYLPVGRSVQQGGVQSTSS